MTDMRESWLAERADTWQAMLEQLVRAQSPTGNRELTARCAHLAADLIHTTVPALHVQVIEDGPQDAGHVLATRAGSDDGRPAVLLLGHLDTVWTQDTYQPVWRIEDGRAYGPGVFDMKAGVVIAAAALAYLDSAGGSSGHVTMLLTTEEETGSRHTRDILRRVAREHDLALVLEPPAGAAVKYARKGLSEFHIGITGRAAHPGLDPERGINAILGLGRFLEHLPGQVREFEGVTVFPTLVSGGSRANVIPAEARAVLDVRYWSVDQRVAIIERLQSLAPVVAPATLTVKDHGGFPPMRSPQNERLRDIAVDVARDLGHPPLESCETSGASDGNFLSEAGLPVLDGLGCVGANAHAEGEYIELDQLVPRAGLLAGVLERLWSQPWT